MALSIIRLQEGKLQESIFIRTVPLYYIKCEKVFVPAEAKSDGKKFEESKERKRKK